MVAFSYGPHCMHALSDWPYSIQIGTYQLEFSRQPRGLEPIAGVHCLVVPRHGSSSGHHRLALQQHRQERLRRYPLPRYD